MQYLLGGIIITESVFNYPGIGNKLVQAVSLRDVQEIGVIAMILAAIYIVDQHRRRPRGDARGAQAEDGPVSGPPAHASLHARRSPGRSVWAMLAVRPRGRLLGPLVCTARDRRADRDRPARRRPARRRSGTDYLGRDVLSRVLHGGLSVICDRNRGDPARLRGRGDRRADRRLPALAGRSDADARRWTCCSRSPRC